MKDFILQMVLVAIAFCTLSGILCALIIDYFSLKRTVNQLRRDLISLEEDCGIFKGAERR